MDDLNESILKSELIYDGYLVKLWIETIRLPNGTIATREVVRHPGAVAMVPLLDNGDVILVRQFRLPAGQELLEIPAGTLEPGEEPFVCAARELQEEIGYKPGKLEPLSGEYTAPGYTSEFIHFFLATGLEPSVLAPDTDEFVVGVRMPFGAALQQVESGIIQDGKTIAALLLAARRLGK